MVYIVPLLFLCDMRDSGRVNAFVRDLGFLQIWESVWDLNMVFSRPGKSGNVGYISEHRGKTWKANNWRGILILSLCDVNTQGNISRMTVNCCN